MKHVDKHDFNKLTVKNNSFGELHVCRLYHRVINYYLNPCDHIIIVGIQYNRLYQHYKCFWFDLTKEFHQNI